MVDPCWFREKLHPGYTQGFEINEVLFESQTEHQHLLIFKHAIFGTVLALDGIIQTTEIDEFIYHEMFAHVPLLTHPDPQRVLILGGGDGGLLREVLKHPCVTSVVMVEIDPEVVELSKRFLPHHSQGAFDDPRLDLVFADGAAFVAQCHQSFDVILSDSTDPVGPGAALFAKSFYQHCARCLANEGVLVTQNGVDFLQLGELLQTHQRFSGIFPEASFYRADVPTYVGGNMCYAWGSRGMEVPVLPSIEERFAARALQTRYYTPKVHMASFALPCYVESFLASAGDDAKGLPLMCQGQPEV